MLTSLQGIAKRAKEQFNTLGRNAEASISEEPGAGKSHAGICAGGGRVTALSTATAAVSASIASN